MRGGFEKEYVSCVWLYCVCGRLVWEVSVKCGRGGTRREALDALGDADPGEGGHDGGRRKREVEEGR